MNGLAERRRYFAEEIQVVSNITSPAVVSALASIPRERYLPPGPWTIRGEADFQAPPRLTADADPRHVYHNVAVAIDAQRMLFNGAPGLLAMAIDALDLQAGDRVMHLGTGLGYYTAVMADCVGPTGRVLGVEVDVALARGAAANLLDMPWVEVRRGDGSEPLAETFDAILINAGVTHPLASWLDALAQGGRMILPLTATLGGMATIGKGPLMLATRTDDAARLAARMAGFVAIYSGVGLRDEAINARLGQALARSPFAPIKTLRRDPHEATSRCWLHGDEWCWSE
jgi:protein-L-isoaspartate(D-aspartate) O-methyltransferase